MAEDKKPTTTEGSGDNLLWTVIGFVFIMMVVGTYLGADGTTGGNGGTSGVAVEENPGLIDSFLSSSAIEAGTRVINRGVTTVRQAVGGTIIGEQPKRAIGEIMEGPIEAFNQKWFRVNYKEAPDGWVTEDQITADIGRFRLLNAFPIFFSVLRPIGLIIGIIFFVLLILILLRQQKTSRLIRAKKELERQSAKHNIFAQELLTEEKEGIMVDGGSTKLIQVAPSPLAPAHKSDAPVNLPTGDLGGLKFQAPVDGIDVTGPKNAKWDRVKKLINSHNASDWKQAIMEADIMLDEMLIKMGYDGNSIGDKLKQIEESDFLTLNKAWEAHKVRNNIAHRGGDFLFSKSEAERIIGLYEKVFEEFYYV